MARHLQRYTAMTRDRYAVIGFLLLMAGCAHSNEDSHSDDPTIADPNSPADVWGDDNRYERYQLIPPAVRHAANASVALVSKARLTPSGDGYQPSTFPLELSEGVCSNQRFADQPTLAYCSGTLVGPDIVLTAGHCLATRACASMAFVFHYAYRSAEQDVNAVAEWIPAAHVYRCAEVIAAVDEGEPGADYAIIRLDRAVTVAAPAPLAGPTIVRNERAVVIGHPSGLPQKIGLGQMWLEQRPATHVAHDADTLRGVSGGGLFNARGELVGVHVLGNGNAYVHDSAAQCEVLAQCGVNVECSRPNRAYGISELYRYLAPLGIAIPQER